MMLAPSQSKHLVDSSSLVYHLDVFLLIVILVFAAFNAPRAITRFAHRSEWLQGHILYSLSLNRKHRADMDTRSIYLHSDPHRTVLELDGRTSDAMHTQNVPYFSQSTHLEKALPPRPLTVVAPLSTERTWHMPMISSLVHPISSLLHRRVHDNRSLGQVFLMAGYGILILYAGLYRSSPFVDVDRSGWLNISQLPFIYILATKNNIIGILVSRGYEKLNYLHRFAGRFAILAANVHAIGYFYKWSLAGTVSAELAHPSRRWGLVTLVCFDILGIFSLKVVRSKFYNVFFATHAIALVVVLFSLCYHSAHCIPYVIVASAFYGADHILRLIKTRITTATLRPIPELGLTRVEMPGINAGWRAGQHVRLRVLSTAMGLWGVTEVHPFTIASVSKTDEGLVLLCKKAGRWTTKMYEMAGTSAYGEQGQEVGKRAKVLVEGPYGGVGNTVLQSYSSAMFVVGGSGVTFALSAVQELVRAGHASNATDIEIIWCITDPASLIPLVPLFTALMSESAAAARLHIAVFYTRAQPAHATSFDGVYLPPGMSLAPGRPSIARHLDACVQATLAAEAGARGRGSRCNSGVFVGVCGPATLARNVCEVVRGVAPRVKRAVGGIELHEEVFGL